MYNSARYVAESIDSVMTQTYPHWELLVIDDGSKDDSVRIVEQYVKNDDRIQLLFNDKHVGNPSAPRNYGIERAKGDYIAFLDSDDIWLPEKLSIQLELFNQEDTVAAYSDYEKIDEHGNRASRIIHAPASVNYRTLLYSNVIGNLTGMYDVTKVGKKYMLNIHHEDFAHWLSVLKDGGLARNAGAVTALYREHSGSLSSNKLKTLKWHWDVLRKTEKLSPINAMIHFAVYAFNALRKSLI